MGLVEFGSLLTQIIMTFKFGTWKFGVAIILAWVFYLVANPVFAYFFKKRIANVDKQYMRW